VCTATINSPEEREEFKKSLGKQNFQIVELTDLEEEKDPERRSNTGWLDKACQSDIQCDVLVISGHFGGSFFGNTGFELPLNELEKRSCDNSCKGILNKPKEVFLFGCNTLAEKEKDHRTPAQYLQVLLEDEIPRDEAERIVEARYGALGDSFKDRMRRVFSNAPRIYGFDSVGPSGKTVKPFLERYFQKIPDYGKHLSNFEGENLIKLIGQSNAAVQNINNTVIAEVFKSTAFAQCSGITDDDPAAKLKKEICELYDYNTSDETKLIRIQQMLKSEDRLLYIPTIQFVFNNINTNSNDKTKSIIAEIAKDKEVQDTLNEIERSLKHSPALQIDVLKMKNVLGIINQQQLQAGIKKTLSPALKRLTREDIDLICSVSVSENSAGLEVKLEDFNIATLRTPLGAAAQSCLKTKDTRITKEIVSSFSLSKNQEIAFAQVYALKDLPGYDKEIMNVVSPYRNTKNSDMREISNLVALYKGTQIEKDKALAVLINTEEGIWGISDYLGKNRDYKNEPRALQVLASTKIENPNGYSDNYTSGRIIAGLLPNNSDSWDKLLIAIKTETKTNKDKQSGLESGALEHIKLGENPPTAFVNYAVERLTKTEQKNDNPYDFIAVLNKAKITNEHANKLITLIESKNKNLTVGESYIRYILKNAKHLKFTAEQMRLIDGPATGYKCNYTHDGLWGCGDY
jgi:hypothetical protein